MARRRCCCCRGWPRSMNSLKNSSKGEPGGNCGNSMPGLPSTTCVVETLTTEGRSLAARSAKLSGTAPGMRKVRQQDDQRDQQRRRPEDGRGSPTIGVLAKIIVQLSFALHHHVLRCRSRTPDNRTRAHRKPATASFTRCVACVGLRTLPRPAGRSGRSRIRASAPRSFRRPQARHKPPANGRSQRNPDPCCRPRSARSFARASPSPRWICDCRVASARMTVLSRSASAWILAFICSPSARSCAAWATRAERMRL